MDEIKNIPAFPRPFGACLNKFNIAQEGMTLRDYFAGQVLIGELSSQNQNWEWLSNKKEQLANRCYEIADAMLKERDRSV